MMFWGKTVLRQISHIVGIFASVLPLLVLTVPFALAQEDPQTFSFASGDASLVYSSPWNLEINENGSVTLTQGEILVTLYAPTYVAEQVPLTESSTTDDVLRGMRAILSSDTQTRFDESGLGSAILPNLHTLSLYPYVPENSSLTGLFVAILFSDGTFGFLNAVFPLTNAEQSQQNVLNLLGGFDSASLQICTVSTNQTDTVQVRVGPGENRGVNTFLPANRDFTVLGQATIDETIWWKLDKNEVAPQSAAAELWVAASDVDESTGCESVPPAIPPSIVRPVTLAGATPGAPVVVDTLASPFDPLCPGSTSAEFANVMWNTEDFDMLSACMTNLRFWEREASLQQSARWANGQCNVMPTAAQLNSYFAGNWALTDVGTGYFIIGMRYETSGQTTQARLAFNTVINAYSCAWVWDPSGFFWSLARAARDNMP